MTAASGIEHDLARLVYRVHPLPEAMLKEATTRLPLRRLGQSQDIADGVSFLASDRASYITGHVLAIDGGMLS
mgnify:CR=1 FL=1